MNTVRYVIGVIWVASLGAFVTVVTVPPSSFLVRYAPPARGIDRESRAMAGTDPPAAASAATSGG